LAASSTITLIAMASVPCSITGCRWHTAARCRQAAARWSRHAR
jgi:hypothetical protein